MPHVCSELPQEADWSCVANAPKTIVPHTVTLCGYFSVCKALTSLQTCKSGVGMCTDVVGFYPLDPLNGIPFTFSADDSAHLNVTWIWSPPSGNVWGDAPGDVPGEASLWLSQSEATRISIGSLPLYDSKAVELLATGAQKILDPRKGEVLALVKDCSWSAVPGVRFAAFQPLNNDFRSGDDFALNVSLFPSKPPTVENGIGGLFNVEPGINKIVAFLSDGCIVAEASIWVEPGQLSYVAMFPKGLRRTDESSCRDVSTTVSLPAVAPQGGAGGVQ